MCYIASPAVNASARMSANQKPARLIVVGMAHGEFTVRGKRTKNRLPRVIPIA
jgi:hypothetical protein